MVIYVYTKKSPHQSSSNDIWSSNRNSKIYSYLCEDKMMSQKDFFLHEQHKIVVSNSSFMVPTRSLTSITRSCCSPTLNNTIDYRDILICSTALSCCLNLLSPTFHLPMTVLFCLFTI
jgi:hypothetical protein